MKKLYLAVLCFLFPLSTVAQDIEVPLFDEPVPNLGRNAKPLDSLVLTPTPLPEIRIPLDNTPPDPSIKKALLEDTTKKKGGKKSNTVVSDRMIIVDRPQLSKEQAEQMENELQDQIAKAETEEKEKQIASEKTTKTAQEKTITENYLENLFGKAHDVSQFEISGISLGMSPEDVIEAAQENGYSLTKVNHGIPLFRTSFYEHRCREAKIYMPAQIRNCIINQARSDDIYYISGITLQRKSTKESIHVLFSSMATDNVAYKIFYENKGDNSLNFTRKNLAKKLRRKEAFWNLMFETYGLPDDNEKLIWGEPQKAYMQATMRGANYDAYIILENKEIQNTDYFDAEDTAKELSYSHSFTFAHSQEE